MVVNQQRRNEKIKEEYSITGLSLRGLGRKYNLSVEQIRSIVKNDLKEWEYKKLIKKNSQHRRQRKIRKYYDSGKGQCKNCGKKISGKSVSLIKKKLYCSPNCYYDAKTRSNRNKPSFS